MILFCQDLDEAAPHTFKKINACLNIFISYGWNF